MTQSKVPCYGWDAEVVEILPDSGGTTSYFYTMGEIM